MFLVRRWRVRLAVRRLIGRTDPWPANSACAPRWLPRADEHRRSLNHLSRYCRKTAPPNAPQKRHDGGSKHRKKITALKPLAIAKAREGHSARAHRSSYATAVVASSRKQAFHVFDWASQSPIPCRSNPIMRECNNEAESPSIKAFRSLFRQIRQPLIAACHAGWLAKPHRAETAWNAARQVSSYDRARANDPQRLRHYVGTNRLPNLAGAIPDFKTLRCVTDGDKCERHAGNIPENKMGTKAEDLQRKQDDSLLISLGKAGGSRAMNSNSPYVDVRRSAFARRPGFLRCYDLDCMFHAVAHCFKLSLFQGRLGLA
jgi:hypothetical protein